MKITSNEIGPNTSTQQPVDSKIVELLSKLGTKPLIINKLSLSNSTGLQLLLSTPLGSLQLQMPLKMAEQLQAAVDPTGNSKPNVELSLNSKNQLVIKLVPPSASSLGSARNETAAQNPTLNQLVFGHAKLLSPGLLKLESPLLPVSANIRTSNDIVATKPTSNLNSNQINQNNQTQNLITQAVKQALISGTQLKGIHTLASQHNTFAHRENLSLISLGVSKADSLSSIKLTPASLNNSEIAPSQLIKNFLRHSFPNRVGLAKNIQAIQNQVLELRQVLSASLNTLTSPSKSSVQSANQIIAQSNSISSLMNQLSASIRTPQLNNASSVIARLTNSGHFFENKASTLTDTLISNPAVNNAIAKRSSNNNDSSQLTGVRQNQTQSNSTQPSQANQAVSSSNNRINSQNNLGSSDLKLLLVQIKAQVEKLIGQLNAPSLRATSEAATLATAQPTTQAAAIITEQIRRELELNNSAILRNDSSARTDASSQGKRNLTGLPNALLTVGQTNQINRILSEIVAEVRSSLNQIETNQLLSLRTEQPNLHQFLVDLPFAHNKQIDSFELLFEQNKDNPDKINKQWKVVVRFDLEPLGPMFAQVELKNNRISTDIFAESQPTAKLINEHLHVLQQSLSDAGLDIDKIASSQGKIPENLVRNTEHSVDIRV